MKGSLQRLMESDGVAAATNGCARVSRDTSSRVFRFTTLFNLRVNLAEVEQRTSVVNHFHFKDIFNFLDNFPLYGQFSVLRTLFRFTDIFSF